MPESRTKGRGDTKGKGKAGIGGAVRKDSNIAKLVSILLSSSCFSFLIVLLFLFGTSRIT